MATVTFDKATCLYPGEERPAVDALDLAITDGEFLVLVGPSGAGKSTSLRMLAGLEGVNAGAIRIGNRDVTHLPPKDRDIAMVFQNYAIYPHMNVAENMGFALKISGVPKEERERRVRAAARLLDLEESLECKPAQLSAAQRQRLAMGRAVVRNPQVFLMDEPVSKLYARMRVQTRAQIALVQRRLGVTTVYVTHDHVEALTMGDRLAVLKDGVLQQVGTPHALYDRPGNVFVAGFVGSPAMNLSEFRIAGGGAHLGQAEIPLPRATLDAVAEESSDRVTLGFRPESLDVVGKDEPESFSVVVTAVKEFGSGVFLFGALPGGQGNWLGGREVIARVDPRRPPAKNELVHLKIRPGEEHVFSSRNGRRLPS